MTRPAFTHLDKVFWPKEGYTKGDVIGYYDRIAGYILPYLRGRPMVLNRHPNGIKGKSFFQKNVELRGLPPFVDTISVRARSTGRYVRYIVCNNKATLLYLANLDCIELHPWLSRTKALRKPTCLVIDLDPGRNSFAQVIAVARAVRRLVQSAGGHCLVKTSGKTGLHIHVPLRALHDFAEVRGVARTIVQIVNKRLPKLTSLARSPSDRRNRIYLDYARNSIGQTLAAPYSLRAFPQATVATPVDWSELTRSFQPARFRLKTITRRLYSKGDVWRDKAAPVNLAKLSRRLTAIAAGEKLR
jgi:bifunctional non-homologous end joining protein LigD